MRTINCGMGMVLIVRKEDERDVLNHLKAYCETADTIGSVTRKGVECNLYPFAQTVSKPNVTVEDAVENIDIAKTA